MYNNAQKVKNMSDLRKRALYGPVTTTDGHFRTQAWGDDNGKMEKNFKHERKWDLKGSTTLLGTIGVIYAILVGGDVVHHRELLGVVLQGVECKTAPFRSEQIYVQSTEGVLKKHAKRAKYIFYDSGSSCAVFGSISSDVVGTNASGP